MSDKTVVNFKSFYPNEGNKKPFNREDFEDFFTDKKINLKKPIVESVEVEEEEDIKVEYPESVEHKEPVVDDVFEPAVDPEDFIIGDEEDLEMEPDEEEFVPSLSNKSNFNDVKEKYYTVYKDKFENFSCNVFVEGAKINNTKARLILESDDWNLVFDGDIDEFGKCNIPIKKLNILDEGLTGKIRLEVIAENTIFIPWEDQFRVKQVRKVEVEVPTRKLPKEPSVKVNFRK